jgi:hypothetical protein
MTGIHRRTAALISEVLLYLHCKITSGIVGDCWCLGVIGQRGISRRLPKATFNNPPVIFSISRLNTEQRFILALKEVSYIIRVKPVRGQNT